MSIFKEEYEKFKSEIIELYGKAIVSCKENLICMYRKLIRFILYTFITLTISSILLVVIYFLLKYFAILPNFDNVITWITVGILFIGLILLINALSDGTLSSPTVVIVNNEPEAQSS